MFLHSWEKTLANMKIKDIKLDVIERSTSSLLVKDHREDLGGKTIQGVLRVYTDEGIEGNCLIGQQAQDATLSMKTLIDQLKPVMMGRSIYDWEWLWHQVEYMSCNDLPLQPIAAPLDIALWDIAGKVVGLPIYKLLGTFKTETPIYATFPPRHACPEKFVEEAIKLQDEGFTAYKIHPGPMSVHDTITTVDQIRLAVGSDMILMLDRNHGYTYEEALLVGRAVDANQFYWFEDPVPYHQIGSIKKLAESLDTPINMSDSMNVLFHEAAQYLRQGHLKMIRGSVRKFGITGLKKLCSMTEGFRKQCEIGLGGNSAMNMANLHVILSVSNNTFYEYWLPEYIHQWGVIDELSIQTNGMISAPKYPGLGLHLDEDWIISHRIAILC